MDMVNEHFFMYYTGIMRDESHTSGHIKPEIISMGNVLSVTQQLQLVRAFDKDDVKRAVFSIDSCKSPGSDGFGSDFFKKMWSSIRDEVSNAVLQFFESGHLPVQLHHTLITLLPKVEPANIAKDYTPIACSQTLYKVVSKILCLRLSLVLPSLVGEQ